MTDNMPSAAQLEFLEQHPEMPGAVPALLGWYRTLAVKYANAVEEQTRLLAELHRLGSDGPR